jgi:hypothetical protein
MFSDACFYLKVLFSSDNVLNLMNVINLVWGARSSWFNLGIQLGIGMERLEDINVAFNENGNRYVDLCLHKMLLIWLDSSSSWEDLATALEHGSVGYCNIAKIIREKFDITRIPSVSCECTTLL